MNPHDRRRHRRIALLGSFACHVALIVTVLVASSWPASSMPGNWINHLWQSTVYTAAIGFLTLGFKSNHAGVRYWLWFSASIKFVFPFSLLMAIGGALPWRPEVTPVAAVVSSVIIQIGQPFLEQGSSTLIPAGPAPAETSWLSLVVLAIWMCGVAAVLRLRLRMWRAVRRALATSTPMHVDDVTLPAGVRLRAASGVLEPGVVGFWRPVILLPADVEQYLAAAQLDAVLAHEIAHIRRRDNLCAFAHMLIETIFWFHPLVWWIGGRLIEEREHACDEEVLRLHGAPRTYAEGIIRVCERYVEARVACVAGVSGSDLKKRIEAIMGHQTVERVSARKKCLLMSLAIATTAIPIIIGTFDSPRLLAQQERVDANLAFDAASVKRSTANPPRVTMNAEAEGWFIATNVTAAMLIRFAYDVPAFRVSGGPDWLDADRFDVTARGEGNPSLESKRIMLRRLLGDRFKLITHTDTRELPIYALTLKSTDGRLGPRLRRSETDCARVEQPSLFTGVGPAPSGGPPACGYFGFSVSTNLPSGRGGLAFRGLTMPALALKLIPMVRRTVIDDTGLAGYFDAEFDFLSELPPPPPPPGMPNPWTEPFVSVFTVFPEQLGLKLDSRRGQVDVLVIDGAEQPTEN